jgi:hypothetical protein
MLRLLTVRFQGKLPALGTLLLPAVLLWGCGGSGSDSGGQPPPLSISTTALPSGQVGKAYTATLKASGGMAPLSWALTAGTLPAGLALNAAGMISGTPTATAAALSLTFTVSDSASPMHQMSTSLPLTVSSAATGSSSVAITPARASLTVTQPLTLAATTSDHTSVSWTSSGGSLSSASSASGVGVTFTAPAVAGVYTITATSGAGSGQSASITVGVTDLAGVYTYHNDLARDGTNTHEFALTPANVKTASFGKLFSCTVDGAVFAQPLWVANLSIAGKRHNVILVATAHDSLYAFDADVSPCTQLWQVSLIDASHGAFANESSVPAGTTGYFVGKGQGSMAPEVGVTGTPVIDPASGVLYVVSKSMTPNGAAFFQRLHAIDITTGHEKAGSPAKLAGSYPGTGSGGTSVTYDPQQQLQRASLALVSGLIYICWSSHEDLSPWYGWIMGYSYNGTMFAQTAIFNASPNYTYGAGVWMGGGAPAADANGNLYVLTGNGLFDATSTSGSTNDYGDSFLQLSKTLQVTSSFTPSNQADDFANDVDFGSGGAAMVVNLSTASLVVGGGKDGQLYVLNGGNLGGSGDANAAQHFYVGAGIYSTAAFWNNTLYLAPNNQPLQAYAFSTSTSRFNIGATSQSPTAFGGVGSTPSVSASGASSNGIVWVIDGKNYCLAESAGCGPAVLRAYDATSLSSELWNSSLASADSAGNAVKFTVPTVANGKVYVGTRGNNIGGVFGSTSISGELDVYGLKPN